ncbi:precorrin-6A synthase (deacetylating) [Corynebacterium pacaense]|uniref:precorrin-6A synthase (deacetylating) n=1 Tax=Corynebacterium pacaense TaxID=1816684 RepID=UPI0009BA0A1C|nr:precorrin-6A synthase (deacetylating) [Corynebacterium pacaense]
MSSRQHLVIGIGAGSPNHLTLEAVEALRGADVVLALDKGGTKGDLLELRRHIVDKHAPGTPIITVVDPPRERGDYIEEVRRWHRRRAQLLIDATPADAATVAFLVWGDPSLYDSTLRILGHMGADNVRVIPGITAVQALTAAHGILLNEIGQAITITTARNLPATPDLDNTVVMLDGGAAWLELPGELHMWWGAYLSTDHQVLRSGSIDEIGGEVAALKQRLRAEHGWIMDTYLLRRVPRAS